MNFDFSPKIDQDMAKHMVWGVVWYFGPKQDLRLFWHHLSTHGSHHTTLVLFHTVSGTNKHPEVVSGAKVAI
jgi:hypothetical protein